MDQTTIGGLLGRDPATLVVGVDALAHPGSVDDLRHQGPIPLVASATVGTIHLHEPTAVVVSVTHASSIVGGCPGEKAGVVVGEGDPSSPRGVQPAQTAVLTACPHDVGDRRAGAHPDAGLGEHPPAAVVVRHQPETTCVLFHVCKSRQLGGVDVAEPRILLRRPYRFRVALGSRGVRWGGEDDVTPVGAHPLQVIGLDGQALIRHARPPGPQDAGDTLGSLDRVVHALDHERRPHAVEPQIGLGLDEVSRGGVDGILHVPGGGVDASQRWHRDV